MILARNGIRLPLTVIWVGCGVLGAAGVVAFLLAAYFWFRRGELRHGPDAIRRDVQPQLLSSLQ